MDATWFWIVLLLVCVGVHLFLHRGHGGHGGQAGPGEGHGHRGPGGEYPAEPDAGRDGRSLVIPDRKERGD